jgi:hypothetical protein
MFFSEDQTISRLVAGTCSGSMNDITSVVKGDRHHVRYKMHGDACSEDEH